MSFNVELATGEVRLSYVNLLTARASGNDTIPKYRVTALIPKSDTATVDAITEACRRVYEAACEDDGVFGGRKPQIDPTQLLHDGDGFKKNGTEYGPECKGHYVVYLGSPASTRAGEPRPRPGIIRQDAPTKPLTDAEASFIKSGDYGRVAMQIFAYSSQGGEGITASLLYTMWTREGEALGGGGAPVDPSVLFGTPPLQTGPFQAAPAAPAAAPAAAAPAAPAAAAPAAPAPAQVAGTPPAPAAQPVALTPEQIAALPAETRALLGL